MKSKPSLSSVRFRLVLWSVGVMAVILVAMGGLLRWTLQVHLLAQIDDELRARAATEQSVVFRRSFGQVMRAAGPTGITPGPMVPAEDDRPPERGSPFDPMSPRVMTLKGSPYYATTRDRPWDLKAFVTASTDKEVLSTFEDVGPRAGDPGRRLRLLSSPLSVRGKLVGVVQVAVPLAEMERDLAGVSRLLLMLIPVALIVVGAGSAFLTGRLLQPVRKVQCAASRITELDLDERLPVTGGDEFADLAETLNAMLDRIQLAYERQRRFVADASHELRTPLTAIRAHTSSALKGHRTEEEYRRTLEALDHTAAGMGRTVQDLLLLARSDAGELRPELRSVSIYEVFEAAVDQLPGRPKPMPAYFGDESIRVWGDPDHLIRLLSNLLENALRHTPESGSISVTASDAGSKVEVRVSDTGCGIPDEHLTNVFQRFYRVEQSRARSSGGTGLGLAICSSIVASHGGEIRILSEPGRGTTVTILLQRGHDAGDPTSEKLPQKDSPALAAASGG